MKKIIKSLVNKLGYRISKNSSYQLQNSNVLKATRAQINSNSPIIFDIGMNHGQTLDKIKIEFPNSIIHGFEANRNCFFNLINKYANDSSISLNNTAIGNKATRMQFNEYSWDAMSSFLRRAYGQAKIVNQYDVEVTTVDAYCKTKNIRKIHLLKSDTEGFELKVLQGAEEMFKKNKVQFVLIELFFDLNFINQGSVGEIFSFLEKHNFSLVQFQDFSFTNLGIASKSDALFINLNYTND